MKIPDRWLDYRNIGSAVGNFVAFKVPLHEHICQRLPSPERHTTNDVITNIPRLGIVINLTATKTDTKYYQPRDWERFGVKYKWIRTEGRVTPSQSSLVKFCRTVKKFLTENPEKFVGVHCTHGLNRTGYFVCSYLVLTGMSPTEALEKFCTARGHQIERPNYIHAIKQHHTNDILKRIIEESRDENGDRGHSRRAIQRSNHDHQLSQVPASFSRHHERVFEVGARERLRNRNRSGRSVSRVSPMGNIIPPNGEFRNYSNSGSRRLYGEHGREGRRDDGWDNWLTRRMRR